MFQELGFQINHSETEIMIWNSIESHHDNYFESSITIHNVGLIFSKRFKHLSVQIGYNNFS